VFLTNLRVFAAHYFHHKASCNTRTGRPKPIQPFPYISSSFLICLCPSLSLLVCLSLCLSCYLPFFDGSSVTFSLSCKYLQCRCILSVSYLLMTRAIGTENNSTIHFATVHGALMHRLLVVHNVCWFQCLHVHLRYKEML